MYLQNVKKYIHYVFPSYSVVINAYYLLCSESCQSSVFVKATTPYAEKVCNTNCPYGAYFIIPQLMLTLLYCLHKSSKFSAVNPRFVTRKHYMVFSFINFKTKLLSCYCVGRTCEYDCVSGIPGRGDMSTHFTSSSG